MVIKCIERVLVATPSIEASREKWTRAGFAIPATEAKAPGMRLARLAAGAVEIDLCSPAEAVANPLADAVVQAANRGGGIVGWIWGIQPSDVSGGSTIQSAASDSIVDANFIDRNLPGTVTAAIPLQSDPEARREHHRKELGDNPNTVDYLEHIVVMAPVLEDAIAIYESIGLPCKRIREAGGGMRQAFFKLEQTVIEVVAPARDRFGSWGVALMCRDIARAVAIARSNDLQATEPKTAIQGGLIARIVDPIDNVAIAFMQASPS